jgi:hypothetical protein
MHLAIFSTSNKHTPLEAGAMLLKNSAHNRESRKHTFGALKRSGEAFAYARLMTPFGRVDVAGRRQ